MSHKTHDESQGAPGPTSAALDGELYVSVYNNQQYLQGKTVMQITCSIRACESPPPIQRCTYQLLTQDSPHNRAVLTDVILILVPSQNPDGVDIVTCWYRKTLGTPYEGSNPPELNHKYVGHDNNRDWYISRSRRRGLSSQSCTTCGIPRSLTTCIRWAATGLGCSCRHGSIRPSRTSIQF